MRDYFHFSGFAGANSYVVILTSSVAASSFSEEYLTILCVVAC